MGTALMTRRLEWLDMAKGIGILLVVFAHCMNVDEMPFQLIFVFHMPMFFILSGYTFNEKLGFKSIIAKKFRTLVIPYCAFFLVGLTFTLIIPTWRESLTWSGLKNDLIYACPDTVHNSSIWFLICLFWVQTLYWIIYKYMEKIRTLACLFLYFLGVLYSRKRHSFMDSSRLPLCLDVLLAATIFFDIGYTIKRYRIIEHTMNYMSKCLFFLATGIAGLYLCYKENGYVNLHALSFNNPLLYILGGICGTTAVIAISCALELMNHNLKIKRMLLFYGRNSLLVLGFQSMLIRLFILICSYKKIELYLYKMSMKYTIICGSIVTIICTLICMGIEHLKAGSNIREKG